MVEPVPPKDEMPVRSRSTAPCIASRSPDGRLWGVNDVTERPARCTDVHWVGRAHCVKCAIRDRVLFAGLPVDELEPMLRPIDDFEFDPGARLYQPQGDADSVFTIRSGTVKLVQYLSNGDYRVVRLLRQGDVAGLERLVDESYQHAAVAVDRVCACRIPVDLVASLERAYPSIHQQLMRRWQQAVDTADRFLTELTTGSAQARTARLLLYLVPPQSVQGPALHRDDMGAIMGVSPETASRMVADFKRRGWLSEGQGMLRVLDRDAIERMAREH